MNEIILPEKATTGIRGLDEILQGGLPKHRLYLIEGDPGTGKTTLGLQFLLAGAARGERGLYITLSESKEELEAVAASHGWALDEIAIHDLTLSSEALLDESHYTVFQPAEVELDEMTKAILSEVERIQPMRVVFDSLSEMQMLARDALRFRRQIVALKQYFMGRQCTVMLLDDLTSEHADRQLESIAHGVIRLHYNPPEYGRQRQTLRVVKLRGVNFQSGTHDFNIETGGIVVFPRLSTPDVQETFLPGELNSDIENLDTLLGGLTYGTSTIFLGPAGVGKTTLAALYAYKAAERGEHAAIYSFDESLATLYQRLTALGLDIKPHVQAGRITTRYIKLAELTPGELSHLIRQEVEANQAKVVVIDSVNGYLAATPQEQFLIMQFHELLSYLNGQGVVTILIVGQYGLVGPLHAPLDMSYLADTVVLMRYFEAEGAVRQAISVLKKRTSKHERTIREFHLGTNGIHIGEPLSEFQGVLTGVPTYQGRRRDLMETDNDDTRE